MRTLIVALFVFCSIRVEAGFFDYFRGFFGSDGASAPEEVTRVEPRTSLTEIRVKPGTRNLNLREKPDRNARVLTQIQDDEILYNLSDSPDFLLVSQQEKLGYIPKSSATTQYAVRSGVSRLNLRRTEAPDSSVLRQLDGGVSFLKHGTTGDRVEIELSDGTKGYIHQDYVSETVTTKAEVAATALPGMGDQVFTLNASQEVSAADLMGFLHVKTGSGQVGYVAKSYTSSGATPVSSEVSDLADMRRIVKSYHERLQVERLMGIRVFFTQKEISPLRLRLSDFQDALLAVFSEDTVLARDFSEEIQAKDFDSLRSSYLSLLGALHSISALKQCGALMSSPQIKQAVQCLKTVPASTSNGAREVVGKVRIMINLPAERLQVFDEEGEILDYKVVIGHPNHRDNREGDNSKSRVGKFRIVSWHENYSNADYPAWDKEPLKAAFGKWTAKLNDRHNQYLHGTYGYGLIDWAAVRIAPGSHGCIRSQNSDIEKVKDLCAVGTEVQKFYALRELAPNGSGSSLKVHDNIYSYRDVENNGYYYRGSGILVDYNDPADAVTD